MLPLVLLLLLLPGVAACDGGVVCKANGCSLTTPIGEEDKCPKSCASKEHTETDDGSPVCTCSLCGDNHNACVEAYGTWICDGLGPISTLYTGSFGLFALMALAWCFMPCITICVAQITCIDSKRASGREAKTKAWLFCSGVILVVGVFGTSVSFGWSWLIGSFLMVVPFMLDSCYEEERAVMTQVNLVNIVAPPSLVVIQPQPVMMQPQPMMMQQQPMMMQQQPVMMQQPTAFNPVMQQGQGQVIQATFAGQPQMK